jgi:putative transposase
MSLVADNWEEEVIKKTSHKTIQVQIFPSDLQKTHLKKALDVSRYVKNMTLEYIKHKNFKHNWKELRNILVTEDTKTTSEPYLFFTNMIKNMAIYKACLVKSGNSEKDLGLIEEQIKSIKESKKLALKEINSEKTCVKDFELEIHKDIRTCAVRQVCENKKTCETLFYNGEIKWYNMKFKKKNGPSHDLGLTTNNVKFENGEILMSLGSAQGFRGFDRYAISTKNKKKLKGLEINHQVRMTYKKNRYVLHIPVSIDKKPIEETKFVNFCGIDPGCRTFLTTYGNNGITEYNHDYNRLEALQNKIIFLKSKKLKKSRKEKNLKRPKNKKLRGGVSKKQISKVEKKIESFINVLHWSSINSLLQDNDIIYFGDIKSHGIVKNGDNKTLNRNINGLKFYLYKQRLKFKAIRAGKRVVFINEYLTTQGCSKCGNLWKDIKASKTYYCQDSNCKAVFDRDINSAKNICMKGILREL